MNYSKAFLLFMLYSVILIFSCGADEEISPVPEIAFIGFDKNTMTQGALDQDSVTLAISFVDGDGDLDRLDSNNGAKVILTDLRTNEPHQRYNLPSIPTNGVVRGELFLRVYNTCCTFSEPFDPCTSNEQKSDLLKLSVQLIDRAGNISNTVETSEITLMCICGDCIP